jgi:hypothetical protein
MNEELLALKERIESELRNIERTVQRAFGAWTNTVQFPDQRDYYFDSVALNLHSFYNGLERILEVIARQLDPVFPSGERWHRDLLEQMAREIPEVRPAVLEAETVANLDNFLAFRHRIRSLYAFNLDAERLKQLLDRLPNTFSQARQDLETFCKLLAAAANQDDNEIELFNWNGQ